MFQDPNLHLFNDTVQKEVEFFKKSQVDENLIKKKTEEILKYFKIYQYKDSYPHDLSGGERQRVALASV